MYRAVRVRVPSGSLNLASVGSSQRGDACDRAVTGSGILGKSGDREELNHERLARACWLVPSEIVPNRERFMSKGKRLLLRSGRRNPQCHYVTFWLAGNCAGSGGSAYDVNLPAVGGLAT